MVEAIEHGIQVRCESNRHHSFMQSSVSNIATTGMRGLLILLLMIGAGACGGESSQRSTSSSELQNQQQAQKIDSMFASLDADEQQNVDQEDPFLQRDDQTDSDVQGGGTKRNGEEEASSGQSQGTEEQQNIGRNGGEEGAARGATDGEEVGGNTVDQETSERQRDAGGRQNTDRQDTDPQQETSGQENSGGQEDAGEVGEQQSPGARQDTDRQQEMSDLETTDQNDEDDRMNAGGRQETNTDQQQRENQENSAGQDDSGEQNDAGEQQTDGSDQRTPLERGDQAYEDGQYDRAIKFYEKVDPPDTDQQSDTYAHVLGRLGEIYWKEKENYEKAARAYERILDRDETRYQAHLNLAKMAFQRGDYNEMSTHLDDVDRLEYQIPVEKRLRVSLQSKYRRSIAKYKQTMNAETTRQKSQLGLQALQSLSSFIESVPSKLRSEFQSDVEDAKEKRDEIRTLLQKVN